MLGFFCVSPAVFQIQDWFLARSYERGNYCFLCGDAWIIQVTCRFLHKVASAPFLLLQIQLVFDDIENLHALDT